MFKTLKSLATIPTKLTILQQYHNCLIAGICYVSCFHFLYKTTVVWNSDAYYQNFERNKLTTCLNNTLLKMHVIVLFYVFTCEKCAGFMFYTFQAFALLLANIQSIKEIELTKVDCIYNVA